MKPHYFYLRTQDSTLWTCTVTSHRRQPFNSNSRNDTNPRMLKVTINCLNASFQKVVVSTFEYTVAICTYAIQILNKAEASSLMCHCSWTLIWAERRTEGELSKKRALPGNTDTISSVSYTCFYVVSNELIKLKCYIPVPGCSRWVVRLICRQRSVNSERCWEVITLSKLPLQYVDVNVPTAVSWTNWTSSSPRWQTTWPNIMAIRLWDRLFETIDVS